MEQDSKIVRKISPFLFGKWSLQRNLLGSSFLLALFLSCIYLYNPPPIQYLNLKSTDVILGTAQSVTSDFEVMVVDIDEASLQKYGQWPWPRYRLAQLLDTITAAGATSIGVSIIFPEQDRTSPKVWQKNLESDFGYHLDTSDISEEILDHDFFLAKTLKNGPYVLGYKFLFGQQKQSAMFCNLDSVAISRKESSGPQAPGVDFYRAKGVVCNHQVLASAVSRSGFLNGTPDIDGVLRRLPLVIEYNGNLYPSFALAVLMQHNRQDLFGVRLEETDISYLSVADLRIPIDDRGNFFLGPPQSKTEIHISARDIIEGNIATDRFQGKIVLVGLTASGLGQVFQTPMAPATSLLDLHKYSIESLASTGHTIRTRNFSAYEAVTSFILCLCLALCTAYLGTLWSLGLCLLAISLNWVVAGSIYQSSGYLFSPFLVTVSLLLTCVLLTTLKFRHFQLQARSEAGEALARLQANESSLQSILNSIPDIVFRLDDQARISFISTAVCRYVDSQDELLGRSIFDIVAPEDLDKAQYRLNERRTGDRAVRDLEIRLMFSKESGKSEEERRFFSISAQGAYQHSSSQEKIFIGTQGIVKDITERKGLEKQLLQAQKMEVVGSLAAGIAHDLNNILSGLVSYPDLLLLEIPEGSPLRKKILVIQKSGKKAAIIVQDLLTLARRNVEINNVCNMNVIISDYLESVEFKRVKERYPDVVIQTELKENLINIKGSAVHLSKVIMNILHNGLEAMPAGGEICISTSDIYVDSHLEGYEKIPEGEYVCTTVADNGVGIADNNLNYVFEPFFTKKTMGRSGTGLGMTVIWATVKDHKGYLDITSREGHGTILKIYLPATREKIEKQHRLVVLDDYIGSETVLVVDDIAEQLDIAQNMLSKLGYTVVRAGGGKEAIEAVKRQPFDIIVLDMIMADGLDGLETYQEISQLYPGQKAIITSGFSESERVKALQKLGVSSYVQKPYSMETLGMAIREELDREQETGDIG